jgi:cytochrome c oxidase subunit IV
VTAHTRTLIVVWAALIFLLALTIGVTLLPLGHAKPMANIGIAVVKAALIFWFYMHLRELSGLIRLSAVAALVTLAILIGIISTDYLNRG